MISVIGTVNNQTSLSEGTTMFDVARWDKNKTTRRDDVSKWRSVTLYFYNAQVYLLHLYDNRKTIAFKVAGCQ